MVADIHARILATLHGEMNKFYAVDTPVAPVTNGANSTIESRIPIIVTLNPSGLHTTAELQQKIGAPVISSRNSDLTQGLWGERSIGGAFTAPWRLGNPGWTCEERIKCPSRGNERRDSE